MMSKKIYPIHGEAMLDDGSVMRVDFEERWADADFLERVTRWAMVPNDQRAGLPIVVVNIPENGKPVFKARVFNKAGVKNIGLVTIRAYGIGYHVDGKSHWNWLLPTGVIEMGENPDSMPDLLNAYTKQLLAEYDKAINAKIVGPNGQPITDKPGLILPA